MQQRPILLRVRVLRIKPPMLSSLLLRPLSFIGHHGTLGFALSIALGIALPQFASAARPLLGLSVFVFVTLTFMRLDAKRLIALLKSPRPLVIATLWLILAPVVCVGLALLLVGRATLDPGLLLGLAILGAAPPIMSGPAVALLLGLEPTLLLSAVIVSTALSPITAPFLIELIAGQAVPLDSLILAGRLSGLIIGAAVAAFILRRWLGIARINRHKEAFDGVGVLMYFLFAMAAMDGVAVATMERPWTVALFSLIAFAIAIGGIGISWLVLRRALPGESFLIGYCTGQRNMGLLIAALGAGTPPTTFLFFALAQVPIYLMPMAVKALLTRRQR